MAGRLSSAKTPDLHAKGLAGRLSSAKTPDLHAKGLAGRLSSAKRAVLHLTTNPNNIMAKLTFREREQSCEQTFLHSGQWWHLYTPGKETPVIFACSDDCRYAINLLARCSVECPPVHIAAFEIMSDHIHIAASGERDNLLAFFRLFRRRLARYFSNRSTPLPDSFQP